MYMHINDRCHDINDAQRLALQFIYMIISRWSGKVVLFLTDKLVFASENVCMYVCMYFDHRKFVELQYLNQMPICDVFRKKEIEG
jgi:hypothetical protein